MEYKNILLTGGSGELGKHILASGYFSGITAPQRRVLDITKIKTIKSYFNDNLFDAIIHCAALARLKDCEENPQKAIESNIIGTSNLVMETIAKEKVMQKKIRFIHISSDGVYPGTKGNYSEKDETIPYNNYGWSKLGAESAVNLLSNFCVIRTSFFDPRNIKFKDSAADAFSSKVAVGYLVKAIRIILNSSFIGTINIGSKRISDYERYKEFKPSLLKCKLKDISKTVPFAMASDASMDCSLWKNVRKEKVKNAK